MGASAALLVLGGCRGILGIDDGASGSGGDAGSSASATGAVGADGGPGGTSEGGTPGASSGGSSSTMPDGGTAAEGALDARYALWTSAPDHPSATAYTVGQNGTVVIDSVTSLAWEKSPGTTSLTYDAAKQSCATLDLGGAYGPGTWRMPTRIELLTLVDYTGYLHIDNGVFDDPGGLYWTLSTTPGDDTQNFVVEPNSYPQSILQRVVRTAAQANDTLVRCVHGGAPLPAAWSDPLPGGLFVAKGASVGDAKTGLAWQKDASPNPMTLAAASTYCAGLGGAFRLPTMREASTLTDESVAVTDPTWPSMFTGTRGTYWTSTAVPSSGGSQYTWQSDGLTSIHDPTDSELVRCVASE